MIPEKRSRDHRHTARLSHTPPAVLHTGVESAPPVSAGIPAKRARSPVALRVYRTRAAKFGASLRCDSLRAWMGLVCVLYRCCPWEVDSPAEARADARGVAAAGVDGAVGIQCVGFSGGGGAGKAFCPTSGASTCTYCNGTSLNCLHEPSTISGRVPSQFLAMNLRGRGRTV
jgi:hypothetical protein